MYMFVLDDVDPSPSRIFEHITDLITDVMVLDRLLCVVGRSVSNWRRLVSESSLMTLTNH